MARAMIEATQLQMMIPAVFKFLRLYKIANKPNQQQAEHILIHKNITNRSFPLVSNLMIWRCTKSAS